MLTIGKVAAQTDLSTNALRFYEREGLIGPASKSPPSWALWSWFPNGARREGRAFSKRRVQAMCRGTQCPESQRAFDNAGGVVLVLAGVYMLNVYYLLVPELAGF